ncbi:MAG: polyprenol phosphomannose-dependent alpha 1,6 mannosyltransferase MptB [Corynebacterium sp.]|nr:polyprenol phosphomannose-dependent alpha 1,6 mannosyltransferase MptB [Corynebacterium sp.]
MKNVLGKIARSIRAELPRMGDPGSRSQGLHVDPLGEDSTLEIAPQSPTGTNQTPPPLHATKSPANADAISHSAHPKLIAAATGGDLFEPAHTDATETPGISGDRFSVLPTAHPPRAINPHPPLSLQQLRGFAIFRWLGTLGVILLMFGGLGAGAFPVINNPYPSFPGGNFMGRMLQTSMVVCFIGIAFLVVSWLYIGTVCGIRYRRNEPRQGLISLAMLRRTFIAWTVPFLATAPMFTQDIYSYLANGKITRLGLDPYSGGPITILGADDSVARSVPYIWSQSPSPYGPVGLGVAKAVSIITNDHIGWSVFLHRLISLAGVAVAAWAIAQLARRCRVTPQAALWLGILNPLTILHIIGGIHNEAILLGLAMAGFELGLRGRDRMIFGKRNPWGFIITSGALITCAGLVKVTGFIGLGFVGMAYARIWRMQNRSNIQAIGLAICVQVAILVTTTALVTLLTRIPLDWLSTQGGAATIRSWMSGTTSLGVVTGWVGMLLDLGDHTEAILTFTRTLGLIVAGIFILRMILATYRGTIAAIGGMGVATLVLVIFFPVVQPWYLLWAFFPLAAWANTYGFRIAVIAYSAIVSYLTLPRGLTLPPAMVITIYVVAIAGSIIFLILLRWIFTRSHHQKGTLKP